MSKKTFSKRIKTTKTGKLIRRKMGQAHFKSKKRSKIIRDKRNSVNVASVDKKHIQSEL
jgi:ribosomal protein L35